MIVRKGGAVVKISDVRRKINAFDKESLKSDFRCKLDNQWKDMNNYFKTIDSSDSIKFRTLYLYDEIINLIDDKYPNIESSFFALYNKRLERKYNSYNDNYQNCMDILNLFSDIENYLKRIDNISLVKTHHLSEELEISKYKNFNESSVEVDLCQESGHRKKRILPRFACSPSLSCTFKNQKVHSKLGYFVAYFFSNSMGLI